jgi:hypothetical protein
MTDTPEEDWTVCMGAVAAAFAAAFAERAEALAAERDAAVACIKALEAQLAEARTALKRITWALDSDAGSMEATAFGYATRALKAIDNPKGNADDRAETDNVPQYIRADLVAELARAAQDVLAERERQKSVEGWTAEHDDAHTDQALAKAATCYASVYPLAASYWPWDLNRWKPKDRRRNLVKAGALILAEIERLDRIAQDRKDRPHD